MIWKSLVILSISKKTTKLHPYLDYNYVPSPGKKQVTKTIKSLGKTALERNKRS